MNYYATGNGGSGTQIYAFRSKKERDYFVAWAEGYDCRRSVNRDAARRYGPFATMLVAGQIVPDGYGPKTIEI